MKNNKAIESYLQNLFQQITPYTLTKEDQKELKKGRFNFISQKLERKKFRRRKLAEKTREAIRQKVGLSLEKNIPLHLTIPFGGYKHFWNASHPEPDYAELFNFRYITEYLLPILSVYKPGAIVEYISEDLILPKMNNYPKEALEIYSDSFKKLQVWYCQFTPKNLQYRYFRVGDRCKTKLIIEKVESLLPERKAKFEKLTKEEKDRELKRSYRSVMWKGEKDLTNLNEQQKSAKIIESRLIELAYYDVEAQPEFLGNYLNEDNHIGVMFSFGLSHDNDVYQDLT